MVKKFLTQSRGKQTKVNPYLGSPSSAQENGNFSTADSRKETDYLDLFQSRLRMDHGIGWSDG